MVSPRHDRVTYSGVFGEPTGPTEIWSFSMTYAYIDALGATTEELASRASARYEQWIAPLMTNTVNLTRVRVSRHNAGGLVTTLGDGAYDQGDDTRIVQGARTQNARMPLQTALCVSFSSARPDASGKGRIFLPWPGFQLSTDWRISTTDAADAANAVKGLANSMEQVPPAQGGSAGGLGRHAVISGKGTSSEVLEYRCGRVPDTMRSRRNALPEAYVFAA